MNWKEIWLKYFGTTEYLGINMGFWVSAAIVIMIVLIMNLICWKIKPLDKQKETK